MLEVTLPSSRLISSVVAASFILAIGAASAADLPRRMYAKAPPVAPVASWTGCYVGGNIGVGWQRSNTTDVALSADIAANTGTGVVGGVQAGCDYQFSGNWVVGVRGMLDGAGVKGSNLDPVGYSGDGTEYHSTRADWLGTLTARLGYVVTPAALLYVQGGGAFVHEKYIDGDPTAFNGPAYTGVSNQTRAGWTVGAGGEYKFSPNWSVFAEYNYIGLGGKTSGYTYDCGNGCGFPNPYQYSDKNNFQSVTLGVNYRFGGPVVAKY